MFHQRISSEIRSRFASPGSASDSAQTVFELAVPHSSDGQAASPRLLLLPSPLPSASPIEASRSSLFRRDLLSITVHRISAFLAEAAVLTLVLGILDRLLANNHFDVRWTGGALAISLSLLSLSIALDLSARRWLSHG